MFDHKQCQAFLAVAETGSFEQAAKQLFLTASAVTLRVQALEKNLGQLLLIRGRPCTLTKSGQDVVEHLQHTRLLEQSLLQTLQRKSGDDFFQVSVASNADSLATWLLPALSKVLLREKIALEFKIDDQTQTHALLESGAVNACVSVEPEAMRGCQAIYLGKMSYYFIASPKFKKKWFAKQIDRQSLSKAPTIIFNHKDRMQIDLLLNLYGLPFGSYPCHVIPSTDGFLQAIELGLGYGVAPEFMIKEKLKQGILIELLPKTRIEIGLYWHHWKKQSEPMQLITAQLQLACEKILHR